MHATKKKKKGRKRSIERGKKCKVKEGKSKRNGKIRMKKRQTLANEWKQHLKATTEGNDNYGQKAMTTIDKRQHKKKVAANDGEQLLKSKGKDN